MPKINRAYNKTFANQKNQEYRQKIRDSMKARPLTKQFKKEINNISKEKKDLIFETGKPVLKSWGKHTRENTLK